MASTLFDFTLLFGPIPIHIFVKSLYVILKSRSFSSLKRKTLMLGEKFFSRGPCKTVTAVLSNQPAEDSNTRPPKFATKAT